MDKLRLTSMLLIATNIALLVNFAYIWKYGKYYIYESNPAVLIVETVGLLLILGYGIKTYLS